MEEVLKLTNVSKDYSGFFGGKKVSAVSGVNLAVGRGEVFGLLGPNGAGKTTIVKMISGLVLPTSGEISIDGWDVVKERLRAIEKIGVLLEGGRNVYWRLTPRENLRYFLQIRGLSPRILGPRIEELLAFFELSKKANTTVNDLSRGMQQKLALAVALLHDPRLLILDEPTLGLDVEATRNMKKLITNLARQEGRTVILTTHQMNIAQDICDRVGIIVEGRIIVSARMDELLRFFKDNPNLEDIFLAIVAKEKEEAHA